MNMMNINEREKSIVRLIYEVGYISEELIVNIFFNKKIDNNKNKELEIKNEELRIKNEELGTKNKDQRIEEGRQNTENNEEENSRASVFVDGISGLSCGVESAKNRPYDRKGKFRSSVMGCLIKSRYVKWFDGFSDDGIRSRKYFLTDRGYKFVCGRLSKLVEGYVEVWGSKEKKVVLRSFDVKNRYRFLKDNKIKLDEGAHDDVVTRIKLGIMGGFLRPAILHDLITSDNDLYTKKSRADILVELNSKRFIAIEYERTLKSEREYLGYSFQSHGKTFRNIGFIKARQGDDFLPGDNKVERVIVICDTTNIYKKFMSYINAVMVPDSSGKYIIPDKFFVIDFSQYSSVGELLSKGQCTYCKKQRVNNILDFRQVSFRDIITKNTLTL